MQYKAMREFVREMNNEQLHIIFLLKKSQKNNNNIMNRNIASEINNENHSRNTKFKYQKQTMNH